MIKTRNRNCDYEGSSYCAKDDNAHFNHIPHDRDLLHHVEAINKIVEIVLNLHLHRSLMF